MQKVIPVYKPAGLTPLEIIKKVKESKPELANEKITYAGRLDPLAHGVLLLLAGDETKNREQYLSLPKKYKFEAIFGLQTDTYDLLGLPEIKNKPIINVNLFVNTFVNKHLGKQLQSYPPYSSKTVNGKPLFRWARNNKLSKVKIPEKEIEIYNFKCSAIGEITLEKVKQKAYETIKSVHGDFRQEEIVDHWEKIFAELEKQTKTLITAKFSISCSSGTYVRELVHQMGKECGSGAAAMDILRTAVGEYTLDKSQKI